MEIGLPDHHVLDLTFRAINFSALGTLITLAGLLVSRDVKLTILATLHFCCYMYGPFFEISLAIALTTQ